MRYDSGSMLWVKFSGVNLDTSSVPIYELGTILTSLQGIINKMYIYKTYNTTDRYRLNIDERRNLSLQISAHKKSSDVYGLIPFVTDPNIHNLVSGLIKSGLLELSKYTLKQIFVPKEKPSLRVVGSLNDNTVTDSILAGAIYAETVQIVKNINYIGGVEKIDMFQSNDNRASTVTFDEETKRYVAGIAKEGIWGNREIIQGYITSLHPDRLEAEANIGPGPRVRMRLDEKLFHFIRYKTEPRECLVFKGRFALLLGDSKKEFQVDDVNTRNRV